MRAFHWLRAVRSTPSAFDPLQTADRTDAAFEARWRPAMKRRVFIVLVFIGLWVVGIEARLVQLQVIDHDDLTAKARRYQELVIHPEALRGDVLDRHGNLLAYSVEADSIAADPSKVVDPASTVASLCAALGDCTRQERKDLVDRLSGDGQYTSIRRSRAVSPEQVERVEALKLPGIVLPTDTRRYYPGGELAAHVLGFVDIDNHGQQGIELSYDKVVSGEDGLAFVQVDAKRQRLDSRVERPPVPGATLELTLDSYLQHIAERELEAGVRANEAHAGTAVIMDPYTGGILAMANYPTFNPNAVAKSTADDRRNRAVQDVYEPGSTFKIVTASAALEEGIVKPDDMIDTTPGYIRIGRRKPIYDTHAHGVISFRDVIVKSSNVGAIKVGLRTGAERMSRYVRRFGFGQALDPEFLGQSRGIWNPQNLTDSALASVSMGYQISVTPLQMVTAASAVANGGLLMQPHVVGAIVRDGRREPVAPKVLRRVISPETAATLTSIMEGVVSPGGTAPAAALVRYQVAGKTGTAHKVVDGRYSASEYNASFVGFVPSRHPVLTILVVVDTPRAASYYAGSVAGPIFKHIAEAAMQQLGVPPSIDPVPPIMTSVATRTSRPLAVPASAPALLPTLASIGGPGLVPDVRGLGARDALRVLGRAGLTVRVHGSGRVVDQAPEPGAPLETGASILLDLGNAGDASGGSEAVQ
jgi:cell division protein FtsI (penicillin-binding protein 3)